MKWISSIVLVFCIFAEVLFYPSTVLGGTTCSDYDTDSALSLQQKECDANKDYGRNWNCETNSCTWEQDVIETNAEYRECKKNFKKDSTGLATCISDVSKKQALEKEGFDRDAIDKSLNNDFMRGYIDNQFQKFSVFYLHLILFVVSTIVSGVTWKLNCFFPSMGVAMAAGLLMIIGDVATYFSLKNKITELFDSMNPNPNTSTGSGTGDTATTSSISASNDAKVTNMVFVDLQKKSFDILSEEQKTISEIFYYRNIIYAISAAGYMLAGVIAIWESTTPRATSPECTSEGDEDKGSSGISLSKVTAALKKAMRAKIAGKINTSAVMRSVWFFLSGSLAAAMSEFARQTSVEAKTRQVKIENLKKRYVSFQGTSTCVNRTNHANPQCYCYDEFGDRDSEKVSSQVCKDFWATKNLGKAPPPTNYRQASATGNYAPVGCLNSSNEFDATCKCRNYVNSKGDNSCKKVPVISADFGASLSQAVSQYQGLTNSLYSGMQGLSGINTNQLGRLAGNIRELRDGHKKKIDDLIRAQTAGKSVNADDWGLNAFKSMRKDLMPAQADLKKEFAKAMGAGEGRGGANLSAAALKNVEEVQEKIAKKDPQSGMFYSENAAGGKDAGKKDNKNDFFNVDEGGDKKQLDDFVEQKTYNYNKTLHSATGPSLWDLIHLRYQKSAYEKLFGQER